MVAAGSPTALTALSAPIHLADSEALRRSLQPFTLLNKVEDLRIGILTFRERWNLLSDICGWKGKASFPANMIPDASWITSPSAWFEYPETIPAHAYKTVERPWEMAHHNAWAIRQDFLLLTHGRHGQQIPNYVRQAGQDIFIEAGARVEQAILNAHEGPIYIGKDALVMDGALLRGPVAVGEGATVKMGAQLYGGSTVGPWAVAGGEIKNSILSDYANKGHHGYLGDAVIGKWCNLGAGTSCSNVKNNAGVVRVMDMASGEWVTAGQKCGLIMGDYSRSAINTSFNTGTVTGICANVFGADGLSPKSLPSFSRGCSGMLSDLDKELESITAWMKMKGRHPDTHLLNKLHQVYSKTNL